MIGKRLGPYEIRRALGAGGMGEVFCARDTRLDRDVALKVLPAEMVADAMRLERFSREARALAALNHPNIVTIHSTEESEGLRFLTMELVEGESLDRLIPPGGFPIGRFFDIAIPIADAISAAHDKHLTHRDLKPANVMVSQDGRVKVLDFGLASFARSQTEPVDATRMELTHQGTVLGTAPYMSPEQVEGKALDHRSDIFSLGIMLYEMLTGSRPFHGDSSPALMSSILKDVPAPIRDVRPDLPGELGRLIARCLEKDPRDRVQTARDIFNELKTLRREVESSTATRPSPIVSTRGRAVSVAVSPFDARGAGDDAQLLGEGLGEDIAAALSRFTYLRVAPKADARYLVEGSVRKAGENLRVTARLVDTTTGTHLWAETYNRTATDDLFALQDDLTAKIVATVANPSGVLVRSMAATLTDRPYDQLTASELVLRFHVYLEQFRPEEHARLRDALERVLTREPTHGEAWAYLSRLYEHEASHGLNTRPHSFRRARDAAQRAVEVDPTCQAAWESMVSAHFFGHDLAALRAAADRTIALNPLNADAVAFVGMALAFAGDWDRGVEIVQRVMHYNPHHAGWYHFVTSLNLLQRGQIEESLVEAKRVNMPHLPWTHLGVAIPAGLLGRRTDAQVALDALRRIRPELLDIDVARLSWHVWFWEPAFIELQTEGLKKAIALVAADAAEAPSVARQARTPTSAPARTKISTGVSGFTVQAGDADAKAVAEGLSDEVSAGLARFDYLSVVSDPATARYEVGGSVRQMGKSLRVIAHLIDTQSGGRLWTETYTRDLATLDAFALVDDVTDRIVGTVGDAHGALLRSMAHTVRDRALEDLDTRELVLVFWAYDRQQTSDEHARLRPAFERAVERWPNDAALWAVLAHLYAHEHAFGYDPRPDSIVRALRAARRSVDLDPATQHGWHAMAVAYFFERDLDAFQDAVERALTINPRNGNTIAWLATLFGHVGDDQRASELVTRAMAINPHHPGWYYFPLFGQHYFRGEYAEALQVAKKINMPDHLWWWFTIVVASVRLGRMEDAAKAVARLHVVAPPLRNPEAMRKLLSSWQWKAERLDDLMAAYQLAL